MVAINQEDLIGSIVPDVYINRITLETAGSTLREENPHIDHERERISQRPEKDADNLIVKIDFLLKEKLTDDLIGTWFNNIDIEKYLEVKIFQSTDPKLTSYLTSGKDAIDIIDPRKTVRRNDFRFRLAAKVLETRTVSDTLRRLEKRSAAQIISVKRDVEGNDSSLTQFKSKVDDDGNVVYDITYRTQFEIPTSNPEHLAYFAVSSFDVVQLARDFDLDLDKDAVKQTNGKVISEVVIDDFDIVSRSYVFYDRDNKIWAGPVHQQNGQWFSKSRPQAGSVPLTRTVVSNTKVQDFRNVKEIERLTIDFSVIEREVLSKNPTKRLTNDNIQSTREEKYFSDLYLSRDQDGDAKFFFSVDIEKAIEDNALFGRLIKKTPRLRGELIRGSQIRAMRVYRRRIKEDMSVARSGTPVGISPFDKNEPWELIVNSGEKSWKTFSNINNDNGALREFDLATTENLLGVRHFTGMDKTMSDVTDGLYQYIVDMEVDDATVEFIETQINDLLNAKAELEQYLSLGSQLSMSKYLAEVRDPHIDSPSEFAGTQGSTAGNYDPVSNRFTQNFVDMMNKKYSGFNRRAAPWISAVVVYANVLDLFTGSLGTRANRLKVLNSLFSYTSPKTGNPQGVAAVIRLIDKLAGQLAKNIGTTITTSPRRFKQGSSQRSANHSLSKSPKRTFMVRKYFDQIFDSDVIKGVGVDYLSRGEDETENDDGLRVMRADDYIKRVELETLRFFKTTEPDINLAVGSDTITDNDSITATNFSYLTPARFDMPKRSMVMLEGSFSKKLDDSFPQNSPRVNFRNRKRKRNRIVENIDENDASRSDKLLELQTSLLYGNSVDFPVEPLLARNIEGGRKNNASNKEGKDNNDRSKITRGSSLTSLKSLGSLLSVDLLPIRVKPIQDEDGDTVLSPEAEIELVPEITTACQTPDGRVEEPDDNRDDEVDYEIDGVNAFFSNLMLPSIQKGNFRRSKRLQRKPNRTIKSGPLSFRRRRYSSPFSLMNVNNLKVRRVDEGRRGPTRIIHGLNRVLTEKDFKLLPNQLKAVFLQSANNDVVRRERRLDTEAPNISDRISSRADLSLSYEMINKVVYLADFERDDEGNVLINSPVWKTLTEEDYNLFVGQSILCWMRPYENDVVGIKRNKGLQTGVYDEYFMLIPKKIKRRLLAKPVSFNPGTLTNKIVTDIKELFPDLDIVQASRDDLVFTSLEGEQEEGLNNIPVKIDIIETSSRGEKTRKEYELVDKSALTGVINNTRDMAEVRGKSVSVPVQFAAEIVALDCQSENVEPEFTTNIIVRDITIEENIMEAAEEEGLDVVVVRQGIAIAPLEEEEECGLQTGISDFVSVQVEQNEIVPFERAFVEGSGTVTRRGTVVNPSGAETVFDNLTKGTSERAKMRKSSKRRRR